MDLSARPGLSRACRRIAIAAIAAVILILAQGARAAQCPEPPDVSLRIIPLLGEISRHDDVGLAEIRRLAGAKAAAKHFPLLGMSTATFALGFRVNDDFTRLGDGEVCATPLGIELHIGYVNRAVFIARETRRDRCVYEQTLEHELRHARRDEDAVAAFIPVLRRRLGALVKDMVSAPAANEQQADKDLERKTAAALSSTLKGFEQSRLNLHRSLDSDAELARLRRACDGRGGSIAPKAPSGGASETRGSGRI